MTKINTLSKITATAAFGAATLFAVLSFAGSAEAAKGPLSCHGSSAKKVLDCCAEAINNRPYAMIRTGRNCHTSYVVTCSHNYNAAGALNYCRLEPRKVAFKMKVDGESKGSSVKGTNDNSDQRRSFK